MKSVLLALLLCGLLTAVLGAARSPCESSVTKLCKTCNTAGSVATANDPCDSCVGGARLEIGTPTRCVLCNRGTGNQDGNTENQCLLTCLINTVCANVAEGLICPAGYWPTFTSGKLTACAICPPGKGINWLTAVASGSFGDSLCNVNCKVPNSICSSDGTAIFCPEGFFASVANGAITACTPCGAGTGKLLIEGIPTSSETTDSCTARCSAANGVCGYFSTILFCPENYYATLANGFISACNKCPEGTTLPATYRAPYISQTQSDCKGLESPVPSAPKKSSSHMLLQGSLWALLTFLTSVF